MLSKILQIDNNWLSFLNHFALSHKIAREVFIIGGIYLIYLIPIVLIVLWFWEVKTKKVALKAVFAGLISWLAIANILGRLINRPRPVEAGQIQEVIFHRPSYSFPSDHTAFLFAVSISFFLVGYRKLSYFCFFLAIISSFSRIALGFHYPSDILAGAILGLIVGFLVWLFDRPLNYLYNFILAIAGKMRLA
ncbi:MAG: phosphatase PAP2 family protein [Patescibacteria group bacterium]